MAHTKQGKPEDAHQGNPWVIFEYTLMEAMADGVLHLMGWAANRKPLMATRGTVHDLSQEERQRLFEKFFDWQRNVEQSLPEEDRLFSMQASNGKTVWVIEDAQVVTVMYPEEY